MTQGERENGSCALPACQCIARRQPWLRLFCEHWKATEELVGDHQKWCIANWNQISEAKRIALVDHIRQKTPPEMMETWKRQREWGKVIGSDNINFHLGVGMQVRNALRDILNDDELPSVLYPDGNSYCNWDDFYYGALDAAAAPH